MRNAIRTVLVAIAVMISVAANAHNVMSEVEDSITVSTEKLADILVEEGMKMIGTPCRYGGNGPRALRLYWIHKVFVQEVRL